MEAELLILILVASDYFQVIELMIFILVASDYFQVIVSYLL